MNAHQCGQLGADCAVRTGSELLRHVWDPVVLRALRPGELRRRDLVELIGGASDKVLTQSLARLCARGLVRRDGTHSGTRAVYCLTPVGRSFAEGPLEALTRWSVEHALDLVWA